MFSSLKKGIAVFTIMGILFASHVPLSFAADDVKNDPTLSTSLISYWEMEEASGTRTDSHASNDLTDINTVGQSTSCIQGDCADMESTNSEYLSISDASQSGLDVSGDFSVSAWIKRENAVSGYIAAKDNGGGNRAYNIVFGSGGGLEVVFCSNVSCSVSNNSKYTTTNANGVPSTGVWYHVVVTIDVSDTTSGVAVYVNSVSKSVTKVRHNATSIANSSSEFAVGALSGGGGNFDGLYDEFGIWSKELTSGEVSDLYNSGSGIPYDAGGAGGETPTTNDVIIISKLLRESEIWS